MRKSGRPEHNARLRLNFHKKYIKINGKEKRVAWCPYCNNAICNTSEKRLEAHRNICKQDNFKSNKRKNRSSSSNNTDNDSSLITNSFTIAALPDLENCETSDNLGTKMSDTTPCVQSVFSLYKNNNVIDEWNNEVKIIETKRKPNKKKLTSFVDFVSDEECTKINESLLKLLIFLNDDLNLVSSQYLIELIKDLRPAYKIPDIHNLLKNVLPEIHKKYVNSNIIHFKCTGVLLISKSKNDQLVGTTVNENGQVLLVKNQEFADNEDKIKDFILECQKIIENKYNVKSHGLTCEFDLENFEDECFFFVSLSNVLKNIVKIIRKSEIFLQVKELLDNIRFFNEEISAISKEKILQIKEDDIFNDYNVLRSIKNNLKAIQQIFIEHSDLLAENTITALFRIA